MTVLKQEDMIYNNPRNDTVIMFVRDAKNRCTVNLPSLFLKWWMEMDKNAHSGHGLGGVAIGHKSSWFPTDNFHFAAAANHFTK